MVKYYEPALDAIFTALSDRTRRGILAQLLQGTRSVTELSAPYGMSLPGFVKHLQILEDAGLLTREKTGRTVQCILTAQALRPADEWLGSYREFWISRLDALEGYLKQQEPQWPAPKKNLHSRSSAAMRPRQPKSGGRGPRQKR